MLKPFLLEAANRLDQELARGKTAIKPKKNKRQLQFHTQCHSGSVTRQQIQAKFRENCPNLLDDLNLAQFTIACSQQPNLQDMLTKTKLQDPKGKHASNIFAALQNLGAQNTMRQQENYGH